MSKFISLNIAMKDIIEISKLLGHSSEIITFENYTDKNEIIIDCLQELEPYIEKLMPEDEEIQNIDCTEILTDEIMQDIYENFIVINKTL